MLTVNCLVIVNQCNRQIVITGKERCSKPRPAIACTIDYYLLSVGIPPIEKYSCGNAPPYCVD